METRESILLGSMVGASLAFYAQLIQPLTVFLAPVGENVGSNLLVGNPTSALLVYVSIPIIAGSLTGVIESETPGMSGLVSGLVAGIINLAISLFDLAQLGNFSSQLQNQFAFFTIILTLLWAFIAAFSAKAAAWSLGKH